MCRDLSRTYRYIKVLCNTSYFQGRNSDEDVYNQLANFLFSDLCSFLLQILLTETPNAFRCYNLSCNMAEYKTEEEKREDLFDLTAEFLH